MTTEQEFYKSSAKDAIDQYVIDATPPGGFLRAVLENDLKRAVSQADNTNMRLLGDIVRYLYCHVPFNCWGDKRSVKSWRGCEAWKPFKTPLATLP